MSHGTPTILVVEDDAAIRRGVVDALSGAGYQVLDAPDGKVGMERALTATYDLLLLDLVLPHFGGFEILEALAEARPGVPVIILSAKGQEDDRARGLGLGADDYMVKPFSVRELIARVQAVLRRSPERPQTVAQILIPGGIADLERAEVVFESGDRETLSSREVEVLSYLAQHSGRAVSRDELLRRVWRIDPTNVETRTIDMHVAHLRGKLRDTQSPSAVLVTVRGKGYSLAKEALASSTSA